MKKNKTIMLAVGLVVLLLGATIGYDYLSANYATEAPLVVNTPNTQTTNNELPSKNTETSNAVETNETDEADNSADEVEAFPYVDFTGIDYDGNEVMLSDYIGKPIVLNFWASWCPPCKEEMPYFQTASETYEDEVTFLMVNLTDGGRETVETAKEYLEDSGYNFEVIFDTNQDAAINYGVSALPSTIFIDADGNLITGVQGMISEENLLYGIDLIK